MGLVIGDILRFRLAQQPDPTGEPDDRPRYTTPRDVTWASEFRVSVSSPLLDGYDEPKTLHSEIKSAVQWALTPNTVRL